MFSLLASPCLSQDVVEKSDEVGEIMWSPRETYPEFPGGEKALFCFIDENVDKEIIENLKEGMSIAQFTVDTSGQVQNIRIARSLTKVVDEELIRIIRLMPNWILGKLGDDAVEVNYALPLKIPYKSGCIK